MTGSSAVRTVACLALLVAPLALRAQDERLTVHGSVTAAYGKTDGLPYFGFNKDGTTDYRTVALQFGYKLSDNSRVVVQLLNRRFGTSPLNAIEPDVEPIWAFYERRFDNGFKVKLGRNPMPRGLFNETRYIGTLLPLYRAAAEPVYGETFDFIDGALVTKAFPIGRGYGIEANVFAGGSDLKYVFPAGTNVVANNSRNERQIGTQLWLTTPLQGVRVGAYGTTYQPVPNLSLPDSLRPQRGSQVIYSADATFDRAFARAEYVNYGTKGRPKGTSGYYTQAGVKPHEQVTLTVQYSTLDNPVDLPAPIPQVTVPLVRETAIGVMWKPTGNFALKLEGHTRKGYSFDSPVPTINFPTAPPFVATLAPASKTNFVIASVAVSF